MNAKAGDSKLELANKANCPKKYKTSEQETNSQRDKRRTVVTKVEKWHLVVTIEKLRPTWPGGTHDPRSNSLVYGPAKIGC